jgi:Domain of unknown function (DUF5666)
MSVSMDVFRSSRPAFATRVTFWHIVLLVWMGLLASCGGETGGVGVGGTGTGASQMSTGASPATNPPVIVADIPVTVTGPITGFGSVIVNGVKFDDTSASVLRDAVATSNATLRLGMTVEVMGKQSADGLVATASSIKIFSELKGPIQMVTSGANALNVLGVAVRVDASTVIAGASSFAAIKSGDVVEAYGLRDPSTGEVFATRIEVEPNTSQASVISVTLNGSVQNLNSAAQTFSLNGQSIGYAGATISVGLVSNSMVQVRGTMPSTGGLVSATLVTVQSAMAPNEGQVLEFEGIVTDYISSASFRVNSNVVDASSPSLSATELAKIKNGARCSIKGKVVQSIVRASELECTSGTATATSYEVSGSITSFTSASNFTARNQVIDASAAVFSGGKLWDLALGRRVHVKGPVINNVLKAKTLEFE